MWINNENRFNYRFVRTVKTGVEKRSGVGTTDELRHDLEMLHGKQGRRKEVHGIHRDQSN